MDKVKGSGTEEKSAVRLVEDPPEQDSQPDPPTPHPQPDLPPPPSNAPVVPSHWMDYDGAAVLVQLRRPMLLVSYPNQAIERDGNLVTTDYLRGICSVRGPDLHRNITVITQDPFQQGLIVTTLIPVDLIAYISKVDDR